MRLVSGVETMSNTNFLLAEYEGFEKMVLPESNLFCYYVIVFILTVYTCIWPVHGSQVSMSF